MGPGGFRTRFPGGLCPRPLLARLAQTRKTALLTGHGSCCDCSILLRIHAAWCSGAADASSALHLKVSIQLCTQPSHCEPGLVHSRLHNSHAQQMLLPRAAAVRLRLNWRVARLERRETDARLPLVMTAYMKDSSLTRPIPQTSNDCTGPPSSPLSLALERAGTSSRSFFGFPITVLILRMSSRLRKDGKFGSQRTWHPRSGHFADRLAAQPILESCYDHLRVVVKAR